MDVHLSTITKVINLSLRNVCLPNDLKSTEVSPIFNKKDNDLKKENYRSVSAIPHVSKRIMYTQINDFMEGKLSTLLAGFKKNHSTQHW